MINETVTCDCCDATNPKDLMQVRCYASQELLNVVSCVNCGLVFLSPKPDKSKGLAYFDNAYSQAEGFEDHSYYINHEAIFERNKNRFKLIDGLKTDGKKILDFGAGQGHFVKVAQDKGWHATGLELSEQAIIAAKKNFDIRLLDSTDKLGDNKFDVITLWDVIEHLEYPKEILVMLSKFLKPDGYFIIETSNIDSLDYLANKKKWGYWHIDHYFYFSEKTLKLLLDNIGFKTVKDGTVIYSHEKSISKTFDKIKRIFTNPGQFIINLKKRLLAFKYKNMPSNSLMTVVATRKS